MADQAIGEYILDAAGLHPTAHIPLPFTPEHVLCDGERNAIFIEEYKLVQGISRIHMFLFEHGNLTEQPLQLLPSTDMNIWCWSRAGHEKIALFDWETKSLYILEYLYG